MRGTHEVLSLMPVGEECAGRSWRALLLFGISGFDIFFQFGDPAVQAFDQVGGFLEILANPRPDPLVVAVATEPGQDGLDFLVCDRVTHGVAFASKSALMLLPQCSLAFFAVILMRNYAGIGQRIDAPPRNITASGDHIGPELRADWFIGRANL